MGPRVASAFLALALTAATAPPDLQPPVTLSGTRTVVDAPFAGSPVMTTSYPVAEKDVGLQSRTLVFGSPPSLPDSGFQPVTESITSLVAIPNGSPTETLSIDTETRIDRDAYQPDQVNDMRSVTTTGPGQVATTEHVVEAVETNGATFASVDFVRTTNLDGSFDETGSVSEFNTHSLHVGADFAANSHDQTPGFSLRDVSTSTPSSDGPTAMVHVIVAFRGRTVGNVPIVTTSYTVRRWFPVQPRPTLAERAVTPNASLPPECGTLAPASHALFVHARRRQIDPTGSIRELVRDTYYDAGYAAVCRIETSSSTGYDAATGAQTSLHSERTVLARTPR